MELGFYDLFTSYEMELEAHVHVWYVELLCYGLLVWYDVSMLWYMLCYYRVL